MYYPILRGRQNELLAIKELCEAGLLSNKIVPIIEPVKLSPTLVNTIDSMNQLDHQCVVIRNPKVGSFYSDSKNQKNEKNLTRLLDIVNADNSIVRGFILDPNTERVMDDWRQQVQSDEDILTLCLGPDSIKYYQAARIEDSDIRVVVPFSSAFRRIRKQRIMVEDKFNKKPRNSDYHDEDDEFFSSDHLFFSEDGYIGFSDYSVIGEEFSETGFAPYAVAIHIVYFDSENNLRIHHFVSENNDDITDPAGKFYEALEKLVSWNQSMKLDTVGIKKFEEIFDAQTYPGLGVVKKLSIMHHFELLGRYLDEKK